MNTAVATSLFAQSEFDPFLTISYAREHKIDAVQFYMSRNIQKDASVIKKIRSLCEENSIRALCHSPFYIADAAQKEHCDALLGIFPSRGGKNCVFHFDEDGGVGDMIDSCEKILGFGLTPCIENFYKDKSIDGICANIEKYLSFFDRVISRGLPVTPVLDFPRLFAAEFTKLNPVFLSLLHIQKFAGRKIVIHAIDSSTPRQDRDDWRAVGEGIVAYRDIFQAINRLGVLVEYAVLEYENTDFIEKSVANINVFARGGEI